MNYTIKIVDINDATIDLVLRNLIKKTYGYPDLLPEKYLALNVQSNASEPSFFLAAFENDKIIGCNGFLANDFSLNGRAYVGYQSCWSVTHPDYQGKNVFTSLVNEAKKILKQQGAGFLYGIANDISNPIITKKIGFLETPSIVLRIPNIPFFKQLYFTKKPVLNYNNACIINEEQVKEHKLIQSPSAVKLVKCNDSWLWGKLILKRKLGLNIPVFYVGGVRLVAEKDLEGLILGIFKMNKILFVQFFSCETNTFNGMLKGWKKAKMNGFIFFNLNMPEFEHFNLMIGPLDVF